MSTLNFNEIPQHTKDYLASATLAAVRRFAQTEQGKALKEQIEKKEEKQNGVVVPCMLCH